MYQIEYGDEIIDLELPSNWRVLSQITLRPYNPGKSEAEIIEAALQHPADARTLGERSMRGKSIGIIISDWSRFTGVDRALPILFEEIERAGAEIQNISLFIGRGTHREPTINELKRILSVSVYEQFSQWRRIHIHNCEDQKNLAYLGTTGFGTRVYVNRLFIQKDIKILTGAIVYHYFAGFSGGRKSILPGMSGAETIRKNHSLNLDPNEDRMNPLVRIGELDRNPVALDMMESAQLVGVDFILNTVMNEKKQIIYAIAGDLREAHRRGCEFASKLFGINIPQKADIVIASAQTFQNWIQSHKSLYNASLAVKDDGLIILLAECPEGIGSPEFIEWAQLGISGIFRRLRIAPALLGQTAYSSLLRGQKTIIVTQIAEKNCQIMGMKKAINIDEAIHLANSIMLKKGVTEPTVYLMPYAGYTVAFVR